MHLLPLNLGPIADVCASAEHSRFGATTGVQLTVKRDASGIECYSAVATDGRRLIAVEGETTDGKEYPHVAALAAAPNGAMSATIDGRTWKKLFTGAGKLVGKRGCNPKCRAVAVVMGEQVSTIGATNLESANVETVRNLEGRFPNWKQVVPMETQAEYVVQFDPAIMAETLSAMAKIVGDESHRVVMRLNGDSPIVLQAANAEGKVTGVVVPLVTQHPKPGDTVNGPANKHKRGAQKVGRLIDALRKVQRDRDAHQQRASGRDAASATVERMRQALEKIHGVLPTWPVGVADEVGDIINAI